MLKGNKKLQYHDWWKENSFDQPVENDQRTYDNIWNIVAGQGDVVY